MLSKFALIFLALALLLGPGYAAQAKSVLSPRHSGIEPPGGPRPLDGIPANSPGRTAEGGMGYTDAYGNTLTDKMPEEPKKRPRPRPGAYGAAKAPADLPEAPKAQGPPVWTFK